MKKTDEIALKLKELLQSGRYSPGERFPSEYQLADELRVNRATVSKAVNSIIAEGLLERAEKSRRGTIVKAVREFPKGSLVFLVTNFYIYEPEVLRGFYHAVCNAGYAVWLMTPHIDDLDKVLQDLFQMNAQGICTNVSWQPFRQPCVYFGLSDFLPDSRYEWSVSANVYEGGVMMADHLIGKGCTDFVYYTSHINKYGSMSRMSGFFDRMRENHVPGLNKRLSLSYNGKLHSLREQLRKIRKCFPGLNAVVCSNDFEALDIINAVKTLGWNMNDFIVTGFGNIREVRKCYPIPTIDTHHFDIGLRAGGKLVELIENEHENQEKHEMLPVELVVS